ncbi:MAG: GLPGLI family protein [Rhodothermaceae bacterium]|nr:GLPGLI family protein [Rhodothermaceae bacterium]MYI84099.1 GLPGLI family protein [Rhodothermaceae bacterium]
MRYLILYFAFLNPITLLAQSEGTVEYSVTTEMKVDFETVMANLPEGIPLDSAMIARMVQTFQNMPSQQFTVTLLLHYSGAQALTERGRPNLSNPFANISPFGSFDNSTGMTKFLDFEEQTSITRITNMGESVPYVISGELQELDWVLVDVDSTILGHAVKKAEFISDSLEVVAWYAPGIASTAGPDQFGYLPGLPLSIDAMISRDSSVKMSFVAKSLTEGLGEPITPPIGISVTEEEYMKIMMEKLDEGVQFVP